MEIFALSLYFSMPVFVVRDKGHHNYYWAKMSSSSQAADLIFPSDCQLKLTSDIDHFEICHMNSNHYDILICTDGSLPKERPYQNNASTSLAAYSIVV